MMEDLFDFDGLKEKQQISDLKTTIRLLRESNNQLRYEMGELKRQNKKLEKYITERLERISNEKR